MVAKLKNQHSHRAGILNLEAIILSLHNTVYKVKCIDFTGLCHKCASHLCYLLATAAETTGRSGRFSKLLGLFDSI